MRLVRDAKDSLPLKAELTFPLQSVSKQAVYFYFSRPSLSYLDFVIAALSNYSSSFCLSLFYCLFCWSFVPLVCVLTTVIKKSVSIQICKKNPKYFHTPPLPSFFKTCLFFGGGGERQQQQWWQELSPPPSRHVMHLCAMNKEKREGRDRDPCFHYPFTR